MCRQKNARTCIEPEQWSLLSRSIPKQRYGAGKNRKVLPLTIGFGAYKYYFRLLLTCLPSYFTAVLHLPLRQSVIYTSIPWLFATGADLLFGGWLVD